MIITQKPYRGMQLNRTHPLARGLVGCWVMNEATGEMVFDLSGDGNDGTIVGATWNGDGVLCDSDYEHIETAISYSGGTIIIGFKNAGVTPTFRYMLMGTTTTELYLIQFPTTDVWRLNLSGEYVDSSGYALTSGDHYQFAVQWPVRKVYINNDLIIDSSSKSSTITELNIGANPDTTERYSNGIIKYAYFYDRTLSANDIAWLHREPYAMFEQPKSLAQLYYEAEVAGFIGKINGISIANIAKINGVPIANIAKVNGISIS